MDIQIHTIKEEYGLYSIFILINNYFSDSEKKKIFKNLERTKDFEEGYIKEKKIARQQKWYHLEKKYFSNNWKMIFERWKSKEYEDWLIDFQKETEKNLSKIINPIIKNYNGKLIEFNSVLINKYLDGSDYIKQHKDDEKIFNENPTIVSISFGASRNFLLERVIYNENKPKSMKRDKNNKNLDMNFKLDNGTILIMAGTSQKYFSHGIPKDKNCNKIRYNLTFRNKV